VVGPDPPVGVVELLRAAPAPDAAAVSPPDGATAERPLEAAPPGMAAPADASLAVAQQAVVRQAAERWAAVQLAVVQQAVVQQAAADRDPASATNAVSAVNRSRVGRRCGS
jgi:hypothetical protein